VAAKQFQEVTMVNVPVFHLPPVEAEQWDTQGWEVSDDREQVAIVAAKKSAEVDAQKVALARLQGVLQVNQRQDTHHRVNLDQDCQEFQDVE
jgi:hypothetical protein